MKPFWYSFIVIQIIINVCFVDDYVYAVPQAPSPQTPSNGAVISDSTPDLSWSLVECYYFQVTIYDDSGNVVCNVARHSSFSFTPGNQACSPLSHNGTYTWKVRAYDNGWSAWGESSFCLNECSNNNECNDPLESNDSYSQSYYISNSSYSNNNLCLTENDSDWFKFYYDSKDFYFRVLGYSSSSTGPYGIRFSRSGSDVTIETFEVNGSTDTKLELYSSDHSTLLDDNDDCDSGRFSRISISLADDSDDSDDSDNSDPFEPNDSYSYAYNIGSATSYNTSQPALSENDEDWFKFLYNSSYYYFKINGYSSDITGPYGINFSRSGLNVMIETYEVSGETDTKIYLYDSDHSSVLKENDDSEGLFSKVTHSFLPDLTEGMLIKKDGNPDIYFYQYGCKWKIENEEAASYLNSNWQNETITYPNSIIDNLSWPLRPDSNNTIPVFPGRNLVFKYSGNAAVYIIEPEPGTTSPLKCRKFDSETDFYSYGYPASSLSLQTLSVNLSAFNWLKDKYGMGTIIKQNNHSPTIEVVPDQIDICHGWDLWVTARVNDPENDTHSCKWKVRDQNWNVLDGSHSEYRFKITAAQLYPVENNIVVQCTDFYGAIGENNAVVNDYDDRPRNEPTSLSPNDDEIIDIQPAQYSFIYGGITLPHHVQFYIANNPDYNPILYENEFPGSPITIDANLLEAGKKYYWKICGESDHQCKGPCSEASFQIEQNTPSDLEISLQSFPESSNAEQNSLINVTCSVTNHGGNTENRNSISLYTYLSQSSNPETFLSESIINIPDIAFKNGASFDTQVEIHIPGNIEGEHFLIFKIDGAEEWPESNENNNLAVSDNTIKIWRSGQPELTQGILVKTWDSEKVYVINNNQKRWIKTEDILNNFGLNLSQIQWFDSGALNHIDDGAYIVDETGQFVYRHVDTDKTTVYRIKNGRSYAYLTWTDFVNDGFDATSAFFASDIAFSWLQQTYPPDGYEDFDPPEISKYLTPLYRLYKTYPDLNTRDHFYTTNLAEKEKASTPESEGGYGYTYEGIECYIFRENHPGCAPLFRLYNHQKRSHFYTAQTQERDIKITEGYTLENAPGFVYVTETEGLVPLFRLWEEGTGHFFMGIGKHEYDNAINHPDWNFHDQGIVAYVSADGLRDAMTFQRPQGKINGVDLGSGAYRGLNSLDLSMKGKGPSLSFAHFYNSFQQSDFPMGQGWSHNLNGTAYEDKIGNVLVKLGNETSFFMKTSDGYKDTSHKHAILKKISDGFSLKQKNQTVFKFTLHDVKGSTSGQIEYLISSITDWTDINKLTFIYDDDSTKLFSVNDTMNRKLVFTYNSSNLLSLVKEVVGNVDKRCVRFTYENGKLSTFTDARGEITSYAYHNSGVEKGLIASITYPKGNIIEIGYDESMRATSIKTADQPPTIIDYEPSSNTTKVTDPQGVFYRYIHDNQLRLTAMSGQSLYSTIEYSDPVNPNKPTRIVDKKGNVTQFEYDAMGNTIQIINAKNNAATFVYNSKNNITEHYEFHASNESADPTIYVYEENGNRLKSITDPENETIEFSYDNYHQISSVKDGEGHVQFFSYDYYGNLNNVRDAENNVTSYTNNYAGLTVEMRDAKGIKKAFDYNETNQLLKTTYYDKNNSELFNVPMTYDQNANHESVSWLNEGVLSKTAYVFDDHDNLSKIIKPDNVEYTFTYYDNHLLYTRKTPDNVTTTYSYDEFNRLKNISYGAQNTIVIERDDNGNLHSVSCPFDSQKKTTFVYNELNQLKQFTDPYGHVVGYLYNSSNQLKTIIYPDNKEVIYTYFNNGRLKTVTDMFGNSTRFDYYKTGQLKEIQRPNQTKVTYEYDNASRLIRIEDQKADGSIICSYSYELDKSGNIKAATVNEPLSGNYHQSKEVFYEYDKKTNRLLSDGSNTYLYDLNGNRSQKIGSETSTYIWTAENMLSRIDTHSESIEYRYDGLNNRIARIYEGQETRYILDVSQELSQVLAESDSNNQIKTYYVYGPGLISSISADGSVRYFHYNSRGDTIALSDENARITDKYAYDEFGRILSSEGSTSNPFKFVGKYGVISENDGLYFMRARYYDAHVGRFLSEDPQGFSGGDWNLYGYVKGNPLNSIDCSGEFIQVIYAFNSLFNFSLELIKIYEMTELMDYYEEKIEWYSKVLVEKDVNSTNLETLNRISNDIDYLNTQINKLGFQMIFKSVMAGSAAKKINNPPFWVNKGFHSWNRYDLPLIGNLLKKKAAKALTITNIGR